MITEVLKTKVVQAMKASANSFTSASKHAVSLGINPAVYSRILSGDTERVLSDAAWISLARHLGVNLKDTPQWKIAETPAFRYITDMLAKCQTDSLSSILVDDSDIGKTVAAKAYVKANPNAIYIDCSQVKSKQKLIRAIAKEFGVGNTGKYSDVYEDLVYYVNSLASPMIVLDEAGDLLVDAFLEIKSMWNATEGNCGWCMIGADGLKEKWRRAINNKKVGYTELFSRFGKRYQRVTPEGKQDNDEFALLQASLIIKANAPGADVKKLISKTDSSLRRIHNEISKL